MIPRMHDWTGPNRVVKHVHCTNCGKLFEIDKAKGVCSPLEKQMTTNVPLWRITETPIGKYLSEREFEVMTRIARGVAPAAIGNELGISVKTVATYRDRVLKKMGMRSNAEIAVWAYRKGILQVAA